MPFTVREFPGQRFDTFEEYEEAKKRRADIEAKLATRSETEVTRVTATIVPAPRELVEGRMSELEAQLAKISSMVQSLKQSQEASFVNEEGLKIGTVLQGESKGRKYTLEVLEEGYLCSNGQIYESLSGAALGVSGNRRSGWKFWRNSKGHPVGESTGRFMESHGDSS